METPNNHLCVYNGYKLSSITTESMTEGNSQILIGGDDDDSSNNYRVKVMIIDDESGYYADIDLEKLLSFAAKYCRPMYRKVLTG